MESKSKRSKSEIYYDTVKLIKLIAANLIALRKMEVGTSIGLLRIANTINQLMILQTFDMCRSVGGALRRFTDKLVIAATSKLDPITQERLRNFCEQSGQSTRSLSTLKLFLESEIEYYQMFETGWDGISNAGKYYCRVCGKIYSSDPRGNFLFETCGNGQACNVVNNGIAPRNYAATSSNAPMSLTSVSGIGPRSSGTAYGIAPGSSDVSGNAQVSNVVSSIVLKSFAASTVTVCTAVVTTAVSSVPVYTAVPVFTTAPTTAVHAATTSALGSNFTATASTVSNNAQDTNTRQEQVPSRARQLNSSCFQARFFSSKNNQSI